MNPQFGKTLVILGLAIAALGLAVMFWDKLPLSRLPLGRLPGDITIQRPGLRFSFPLTTCILVSAVVSLILWLLRK
ncbi:DUF2905 domain-containing protein [Desulfocurvus sp. DL9XJH121]